MCAIIGWSGKMPTGLLYQLFHAAEHRGPDSTGMAYWDDDLSQNFMVKHAVTATMFTKLNSGHVANAQKSIRGIAHTRRASPRMPINNANAHPFMYGSLVFAHNGSIRNWKDLKEAEIATIEAEITALGSDADAQLAVKLDCIKNAKTDSILLGPALECLDFSAITGSMGLVWLHGPKVFAFRSKKELTAAAIKWSYASTNDENIVTVAASTWEIIDTALANVQNVTYDAVELQLDENKLYELTPDAVLNRGDLPVNTNNAPDLFTSKTDGTII